MWLDEEIEATYKVLAIFRRSREEGIRRRKTRLVFEPAMFFIASLSHRETLLV
jgi:hypothetical protein